MYRLPLLTACCLTSMIVGAAEPSAPRDSAQLEKEFAEKLTGAALVGTFSIDGREGTKSERYEISSATKLQGNDWLITARIKYGDKDVNLPIPVKVYWADDTPMISLTDLALPGLGTFTTRVFFHGQRYAGTWQHDKVGGHMWGVVEKKNANDKPAEKAP
jgi:hypothetical protein